MADMSTGDLPLYDIAPDTTSFDPSQYAYSGPDPTDPLYYLNSGLPSSTLPGGPQGDTGFGGSSSLSGLAGLLNSNVLRGLLGVGSGIVGLSQGNNLQGLATTAMNQSNPFGPYRAQYAGQLGTLMQNPSAIFKDPGYQDALDAGLQGVQRQMAASGFLNSGNEAIALQDYGTSFANQYLQQREGFLANLAGAGVTPNYGPGLSGYAAGSGLTSSGLGSLAYGANALFGGASAGTPGSGGGTPMGFNSAGGEAATLKGLTGAGASVASGTPVGSALGDVSAGLGIYTGLKTGGIGGYGSAALNTGKLASNAGLISSDIAPVLSGAGSALGIYSGVKQGGAVGTLGAATSAASLADTLGLLGEGAVSSAVDTAVPYVGGLLAGVSIMKSNANNVLNTTLGDFSGMFSSRPIADTSPARVGGLFTMLGQNNSGFTKTGDPTALGQAFTTAYNNLYGPNISKLSTSGYEKATNAFQSQWGNVTWQDLGYAPTGGH